MNRIGDMDKILTIKQQVYSIIQKRIADGTYIHGQHLQEIEIADELSVSRTPVREVIKQLVSEGILIDEPNKGAYIKQFSEKEMTDIYAVKMLIECYAIDFISQYPQCFPGPDLRKVKENILALNGEEIDYVVEKEINPHDVFVEATGNNYLIEMHRRVSYSTMTYYWALFEGKNYDINIRQHIDIIDALLEFDFAKAKESLVNHLIFSRDVICKAIHDLESGDIQRPSANK